MRYPFSARCGFLAAVFLGALLRLAAQDITVTPLEWDDPDDPPDSLPLVTAMPKIDVPAELRSSPTIGYTVFRPFIDAQGKWRSGWHADTLAILSRLVDEHVRDMRFLPGLRKATAVNTRTQFAVIFNPASASPALDEATPRLLAVSALKIKVPEGRETPSGDKVIFADLTVDATGAVTEVKNAPHEWQEAFSALAKTWKFAPARHEGKPVAASVYMPFVLDYVAEFIGAVTPPIPLKREPPEYPVSMQYQGVTGEVLLEYIVDIEGRVRNPVVLRSTFPDFERPALEAIAQWLYKPAERAGVPVANRVRQSLAFNFSDVPEGSHNDPYKVERQGNQALLPPQYRYDTPPKPLGLATLVYPYELLRDKVDGKALVVFVIDEEGGVESVQVKSATRAEFGLALAAAAECYTFAPALLKGRPTKTKLAIENKFDSDEERGRSTVDLLRREAKRKDDLYEMAALDAPPETLADPQPPRFPLLAPAEMKTGKAVVMFFVDEKGRVQLARTVSCSDPTFGYAAVQAVAGRQYKPPLKKKKPVTVRITETFDFVRPEADVPETGK